MMDGKEVEGKVGRGWKWKGAGREEGRRGEKGVAPVSAPRSATTAHTHTHTHSHAASLRI